jgi:hypothetical protein
MILFREGRHHGVNLVVLFQKMPGRIASILSGYIGDKATVLAILEAYFAKIRR